MNANPLIAGIADSGGGLSNSRPPIGPWIGPDASTFGTVNFFTRVSSFDNPVPITNIPLPVGNSVTITTASASQYTINNSVTVSGVPVPAYNGTFVVTAATATTLTYVVPGVAALPPVPNGVLGWVSG